LKKLICLEPAAFWLFGSVFFSKVQWEREIPRLPFLLAPMVQIIRIPFHRPSHLRRLCLHCIQELPGSNLGQDFYSLSCLWFSYFLQANSGVAPHNISRPLPYASFLINRLISTSHRLQGRPRYRR
jgi:hypothetical protein